MSRGLTLVTGRANTGKSAYVLSRLKALHPSGGRAVLIVPEQYTFEAEAALSKRLGGLFGIQVLSFERLCERLVNMSAPEKPYLSPQGVRMVIRRVTTLRQKELTVFSDSSQKSGFAADMQQMFADLRRGGLDPDGLDVLVEKLPEDSALREKLADIALLYRDTEAYLAARYLTEDDAFHAAVSLLPGSFLRDIPVFIDGMDTPGRQVTALLRTLLVTASEVTVTLRCDFSGGDDGELFQPDRDIFDALCRMAYECGLPVREERLTGCKKNVAPELAHLERQLFSPFTRPYGEEAEHITVCGATDRSAEAEWLGDRILELTRRGLRYREIAVVLSDMEAYGGLVSRAFSRRGIPVFWDRKRPVTGHAAVDAALSAVRAVVGGYSQADVLRLMKTGFANVSEEDGEALELFLLQTGFRGGALKKPFSRPDTPEGAERARQALMEPLTLLQEGLLGPTVSEKTRALYGYLETISLREQLAGQVNGLLAEGRIPLMEETAQVWNMLMSLLSQMDAILGDVRVSRAVFLQLMEEGLAGYSVGVIPGTADQVLLGDLGRTKSRSVKALFVLGANDGLLPRPVQDDGLLDDGDLEAISKAEPGAELPMGTDRRSAAQQLDLYTALTRATEALYVSFSFSGEGTELAPSSLVHRLYALFPRCRRESDLLSGDALPLSSRTGLFRLTRALSDYAGGNPPGPMLPSLLAYYEKDPAYSVRVKHMVREASGVSPLPPLDSALAEGLYGKRPAMSASRLEQYGACPFRHFLRYGLSAETPRAYTEESTDLGSFYHACLEAFLKRAEEKQVDWRRMEGTDADAIMDDILPGVIAAHNDGIFLTHERLKATLFLLIDTVKASARAVTAQLAAGRFTPIGSEVRFGEGQPFPPVTLTLPDGRGALVSGIIDRADGATVAGREYVRIVDYKTGARDFDLVGILHGLTLQLPIYLMAVTGRGTGKTAAGLYYMPLRVAAPTEEEENESLRDAFRLRGLTLSDPAILETSEKDMGGASSVLYGVKRGEGDAYTGNICTTAHLEGLLQAARRAAEKSLGSMLRGDISIYPAQRACTYCDYRSVCRFDPARKGCATRKYGKLKLEEFFDRMGGDERDMDR